MAKRKLKTLLQATPDSTFPNDPIFAEALISKGANIIRIGITVKRDTPFSMSINGNGGVYNLFNNGDDLLAGVDYVFESVSTGDDQINFRADGASIDLHKLIVESFLER